MFQILTLIIINSYQNVNIYIYMYACRYFNQQLHMTVVLTKGQLDTIIHLLKQFFFLSDQIQYKLSWIFSINVRENSFLYQFAEISHNKIHHVYFRAAAVKKIWYKLPIAKSRRFSMIIPKDAPRAEDPMCFLQSTLGASSLNFSPSQTLLRDLWWLDAKSITSKPLSYGSSINVELSNSVVSL